MGELRERVVGADKKNDASELLTVIILSLKNPKTQKYEFIKQILFE